MGGWKRPLRYIVVLLMGYLAISQAVGATERPHRAQPVLLRSMLRWRA